MNSKKFISLMSAAALAVSSFASLTAFAAGETVLYSDSFNGYKTSKKAGGEKVFAAVAASDFGSVEGNPDWTWIFDSPDSHAIGKLEATFEEGSNGVRGDDTAAIMINEKEDTSDKYIALYQNRFSTSRCKPLISGFGEYSAKDGEDLVIAMDVMLKSGTSPASPALVLDGINTTLTTTDIPADTWTKVKIVTKNNKSSVYIGDTVYAEDLEGSLAAVKPQAFEADKKIDDGNYASVCLDNLVILSAADGETAEIPEAQDVVEKDEEPEQSTEPAESAAPIEVSEKIDADDKFFDDEDSKITAASNKDYTTIGVETLDGWESNAYSIAQTSTKDNAYGYAAIDFSKVTAGKSHVILKYDLRAGADGRIKTVINDGTLGGTATGTGSLFSQGITKTNSSIAVIADDWVTTTVDINLAAGTGTYTVVKSSDGTAVASGKFTTDLKKITALSLLSWSPNTSYIDNIEVQAGGTMEETPKATAEPAAEAEGSNVELLPSGAVSIGTMETAEGEAEEKLNHSEAKKVTAASVAAYSDKARGKSIFAAYDVYAAPGSSMNIAATGNNGQATSSTIKLTANDDNKVILSAVTDKGTVTADKELVCDTWYRVLLEVPQSGTSEATSTGSLTFTVYRINADDQTAASEVAAQLTGLSARGIATRGATAFNVEVTGDVYIDNSQVFVYTTGYSLIGTPSVDVTPEPAAEAEGSNINLKPETATAISDFASAEESEDVILNHSNAKLVQATTDITAYNEKAKNKAVYAAYDIYVEKDSSFTLIPHGDNGNAAGPTLQFAAGSNGAVTVSAVTGSSSSSTAKETLAAGTWYRVLVEMPQTSSGTDKINYTVYRIDANDQTKVSGVAAELTGLSPRGLATKFVTTLETQVEGKAYIDNGTVYYDKASAAETWTKYTAEYDADGRLTAAAAEEVADPSTVDTTKNTDASKTFVWNNGLKPYVSETAE